MAQENKPTAEKPEKMRTYADLLSREMHPARSHIPPPTRRSPLLCAAAGVPLLRSLDAAARENLARCLHSETRSQGQAIVTKGEQGDAMYFVESGKVRTPRRFRRRPARTR